MKIVVVSDTQINSTVGLFPPGLMLDDGGEYKLNKYQQWLWENWLDFTNSITDKPIVVINGDILQGILTYRDVQIVTVNAKDMRRAAVMAFEPLVQKAGALYVVRGTGAHDGLASSDAEDVAKELGAIPEPTSGQFSRWELWLEHDAKLFHFTHHLGYAPVYPHTPLWRELQKSKLAYVEHGLPIPDVQIRSHVHTKNLATDGNGHWIFVTPSWQLKGEYIYKRNPYVVPDIGGLTLWVEDGEIRYKYKTYEVPKPTIEKVMGGEDDTAEFQPSGITG